VAVEFALGSRIRALRQARGMTLRALADRAGVTESFLSQVEREVTSPSIASVRRIAGGLDLSVGQLFADEPRAARVVRRDGRRRVTYPALATVAEFLTLNAAGRLQVLIETIEPGGGSGEAPFTHDADEEVIVVLQGSVEVWLRDERYELGEGDALTLQPRLPHWQLNPGPTPAVLLVCVTPPNF
jgi:transcriptional regulator with XRE-family HTH domain